MNGIYLVLWVFAAAFYLATGDTDWAIAMWALAILWSIWRLEQRLRA